MENFIKKLLLLGLLLGSTSASFAQKENECSICLEKVYLKRNNKNQLISGDDNTAVLECRHFFCLECIQAWRIKNEKATCPHCRRPIRIISPFIEPKESILTKFQKKPTPVEIASLSLFIPCFLSLKIMEKAYSNFQQKTTLEKIARISVFATFCFTSCFLTGIMLSYLYRNELGRFS